LLDPENRFHVIRDDRVERQGGGVCVLIAKTYSTVEIQLDKQDLLSNVVAVDLVLNGNKIRLITVYRPTCWNSEGLTDAIRLCKLLDDLTDHQPEPVFIIGDFNCKNIDWNFTIQPPNALETRISNFFRDRGFHQLVLGTTRAESLLDIVCTNEPLTVFRINTKPPINSSDHDCVYFELSIPVGEPHDQCQKTDEKHYNWRQADYASMSTYLSKVKWYEILTTNFTADSVWEAFRKHLDAAIDNFVPKMETVPNSRKTKKNIRVYPRHIRTLYNRNMVLWRLYRRDKTNSIVKSKYEAAVSDCKSAVRRRELYLETKLLRTIISDLFTDS
jgi:hypothetical protein